MPSPPVPPRRSRHGLWLLLALLLACAAVAGQFYRRAQGAAAAAPAAPLQSAAPATPVSFERQIRPLLEKRCVVCHACYDAPCQLKLGSWAGIARGLSSAPVYDGTRRSEAPTTRLGIDAQRVSQWRALGFGAVLNEGESTPDAGLLYRVLELKRQHPLPAGPQLSSADFDFSADRKASCPRAEDFDAYARSHPLAGMPYGLPALAAEEMALITQWLEAGAPDDGLPPLSAQEQRELAAWERFLNGDTPKERLVARYLYEHLFLAQLDLDDAPGHARFKLVRSRTAPGREIDIVATRRPFDDPGVARVYYRLQRETEPIVDKTHMPYRFDAARRERFTELFVAPAYRVAALPSYDPKTASNALLTYNALPAESRYRFMLDDAQFFVMNFIKGPVCRGQMALNVIQDRFWVFFYDPVQGSRADASEILLRAAGATELPAAEGSDASLLGAWRAYAAQERRFQQAKARELVRAAGQHEGTTLEAIWDGGRANPNAALTVFRQFESATVVTGLVGEPPKTAWVIGYPLFERIYYLLVAGFDVWGNVTHQLYTRLYMDFLRMEGEANFVSLLPRASRAAKVDYWYRDARSDALATMRQLVSDRDFETAVSYRPGDPQRQLYTLLARRMGPGLDRSLQLDGQPPAWRPGLEQIAAQRGAALQWLPESVFLQVSEPGAAPRYYTLLRETGHLNVTHLLFESHELAPAENALTLVPGLAVAYPNAIYRVPAAELGALARAIGALASEADYRRLADRWALRRSDPGFWAVSDALRAEAEREARADGGLFDYNRLENR